MLSLSTFLRFTQPSRMAAVVMLFVSLSSAVVAQTAAPTVPTTVVQARATAASFSLDGVIQPVRQATVAAQASGRIASLLVKAGDKVRAGQVLATIDDRESTAGVQRAQAQVQQAQAELVNARAHLERTRELQAKGFVSKSALDMAQTQHQAAQAGREVATAAATQSALAQGFTKVTAPFDGWVMQTLADAGDLAVPGKPLAVVFAPQPLRAVVQVPASRSDALQAAGDIHILVEGAGGAVRAMQPLARTAVPSADPISQTVEWRFELAAKDTAQLVPGQQVRLGIGSDAASSGVSGSQRLVVPSKAVLRRGELSAVYVAQAGSFVLRAVRTGSIVGTDSVEILAGLRGGETVALDPVRAGLAAGK